MARVVRKRRIETSQTPNKPAQVSSRTKKASQVSSRTNKPSQVSSRLPDASEVNQLVQNHNHDRYRGFTTPYNENTEVVQSFNPSQVSSRLPDASEVNQSVQNHNHDRYSGFTTPYHENTEAVQSFNPPWMPRECHTPVSASNSQRQTSPSIYLNHHHLTQSPARHISNENWQLQEHCMTLDKLRRGAGPVTVR
jgi:hypothetical protein